MARIRTIKPEFWSDERIVELSPMARLLFIGMWNFADDYGGIERSPRQLKMKIFPGDDVDVELLIQELLRSGMVTEHEIKGARYLHIKNFNTHQKINKKSDRRIMPEVEPEQGPAGKPKVEEDNAAFARRMQEEFAEVEQARDGVVGSSSDFDIEGAIRAALGKDTIH